MPENTLLARCTLAYAEAWNERIKTLLAAAPRNHRSLACWSTPPPKTCGPAGKVEWPDDAQRCGTRAVIEHLAAELTYLGHHDAARCLLGQLQAEVIPLRPTTTPGDAA